MAKIQEGTERWIRNIISDVNITDYIFSFFIYSEDELEVKINDNILILNEDFTVVEELNSITLDLAVINAKFTIEVGDDLYIIADTVVSRDITYEDGFVSAYLLNTSFDKVTNWVSEVVSISNRVLCLSLDQATESTNQDPFEVTVEDSKTIKWDAETRSFKPSLVDPDLSAEEAQASADAAQVSAGAAASSALDAAGSASEIDLDALTSDIVPAESASITLGSEEFPFQKIYSTEVANLVTDIDDNLVPITDDTYDLGEADKRFKTLYCSDMVLSNSLALACDFLPADSIAYNIGSAEYPWKTLYINEIGRTFTPTFETDVSIGSETLPFYCIYSKWYGSNLIPKVHGDFTIGDIESWWKTSYILDVNANTVVTGYLAGLEIDSILILDSLLPSSSGNEEILLGDSTHPWSCLYCLEIGNNWLPKSGETLSLGSLDQRWDCLYATNLDVTNLVVSMDFVSTLSSTYNIGSAEIPWKTIYIDTIGKSITLTEDKVFSLGSASFRFNEIYTDKVDALNFVVTSLSVRTFISIEEFQVMYVCSDMLPKVSGSYLLGDDEHKWKEIHVEDWYFDNLTVTGAVGSSLIPSGSSDLGNEENLWENLWIKNIISTSTFNTNKLTVEEITISYLTSSIIPRYENIDEDRYNIGTDENRIGTLYAQNIVTDAEAIDSIYPLESGLGSVGKDTHRYGTGYFDTFFVDDISAHTEASYIFVDAVLSPKTADNCLGDTAYPWKRMTADTVQTNLIEPYGDPLEVKLRHHIIPYDDDASLGTETSIWHDIHGEHIYTDHVYTTSVAAVYPGTNIKIWGNILTEDHLTYTIGSSSYSWFEIYGSTFFAQTIKPYPTITLSTLGTADESFAFLFVNDAYIKKLVPVEVDGTIRSEAHLAPASSAQRDLGTFEDFWNEGYISELTTHALTGAYSEHSEGELKIKSSMFPETDDTVSLGHEDYKWKEGHFHTVWGHRHSKEATLSGTTYSIAPEEEDTMFVIDAAVGDSTFNIPLATSDALENDAEIDVFNEGEYTLAITCDSGIELRKKDGVLRQYAGASLKKINATMWIAVGDFTL